jgi:hypothetical protein
MVLKVSFRGACFVAGKGTVIYKNGDKYEGDWAAGLRQGLGTLWIYVDGKFVVRYNGMWHKDRPSVCARHPLLEHMTTCRFGLAVVAVVLKTAVAGMVMQGNGTFFGNDGELYEGEFKGGLRCGRGKQSVGGRAVDGFGATVYEGEWLNDMKYAQTVFTCVRWTHLQSLCV